MRPMVVTPDQLKQAVDALVDGGIVAFPTETVYGIGAVASHAGGVERIFEMKGRPRSQALIVHVQSLEAADAFAAEMPEYGLKLARAFWPGPLTLVFRKQDHVLDEVTGGGDTVAVRVPNHPVALQLIEAVSERIGELAGLAAPSATASAKPPPPAPKKSSANSAPPAPTTAPTSSSTAAPAEAASPPRSSAASANGPASLRRGSCTLEDIEKVIGRFIDD